MPSRVEYLDFDLPSLLAYFFRTHNSRHWHVLSQEVGCCVLLPILLLYCFLAFFGPFSSSR